ncbi:MAG: KEOPS complex Pcc1-like subunit [Thermoplasmata archaeon]
MIEAKILLEFESAIISEIVASSVEKENYGYVKMQVEENRILAETRAKNLLSLLHTLDDLLACTTLAYKTASFGLEKH